MRRRGKKRSRDLFYYLSLKRFNTVKRSGQDRITDNETIVRSRFQFVSVIWQQRVAVIMFYTVHATKFEGVLVMAEN